MPEKSNDIPNAQLCKGSIEERVRRYTLLLTLEECGGKYFLSLKSETAAQNDACCKQLLNNIKSNRFTHKNFYTHNNKVSIDFNIAQ